MEPTNVTLANRLIQFGVLESPRFTQEISRKQYRRKSLVVSPAGTHKDTSLSAIMNRLKFDLKTRPPPVERSDKEICSICNRQTSRYTCPSCNAPYCSLTCFGSEKHSECSETFYRKQIENDIQNAPAKSVKERAHMMSLLRKFEEESTQGPLEASEDEDLAERLEGVNLDDTDTNSLWEALSPGQRDSFLKAMRNPSSDLAQQLLSSPELARQRKKPWWESPLVHSNGDKLGDSGAFGTPPDMLSIPQDLRKAGTNAATTRPLVYNILALCVIYAYITRRLSTSPLSALAVDDPDRSVALDLLSKTVPFLTDRKSNLLFGSVESLVTDVWSRLEALPDPPTAETFAVYLADTARLIRPQSVTVIDEGDTWPHHSRTTILAISDMIALFSSSPKTRHVVYKLQFYAGYLGGQSTRFLDFIADEVQEAGRDLQTRSSA